MRESSISPLNRRRRAEKMIIVKWPRLAVDCRRLLPITHHFRVIHVNSIWPLEKPYKRRKQFNLKAKTPTFQWWSVDTSAPSATISELFSIFNPLFTRVAWVDALDDVTNRKCRRRSVSWSRFPFSIENMFDVCLVPFACHLRFSLVNNGGFSTSVARGTKPEATSPFDSRTTISY